MEEVLYNVLNWPEIEAIVYSEHDQPQQILGAKVIEAGVLIQTFIPKARSVSVKLQTGEKYLMERTDEEGFYSVILPKNEIPDYTYIALFEEGQEVELMECYNFEPMIDKEQLGLFHKGIHYSVYNILGAHPMQVNGVEGVHFAVWAPNAIRVSVVGDFNCWDGRRHPMRRLDKNGVFELFIPKLSCGELYKYEIKIKGNLTILKSDPYGYQSELRPATASVVCDLENYEWNDQEWIEQRKRKNMKEEPILVYEVHLGSWKKPDEIGDSSFYNYRDLAVMLADYIINMGYTHIEIMPIMEHPLDASWGYQVTGYYAVTSRFGTPKDFMFFVDYMHRHNIGVILDWVPAHFPRDAHGLANFDGTCLYEHKDPRQGSHPHWGTLIYNYGRPEVSNFLIANALYWIEKYHIDGIRMDAVASMLYLDYGKNYGEWVANRYGGKENLEAIELLKHLNSVVKGRKDGTLLMAEESTAWSQVTKPVENGGLGFDYKWNMGWMNDFLDYMKTDPLYRREKHGALTFSMVYAYSEQFILVLSHDEVVHGKGSMVNKMPGDYEEKFANLRVAYGFMMAHPGKKLLFMGQDFAQFIEWDDKHSLDWNLLDYEKHQMLQNYVRDLNQFYKQHPSLYELDYDSSGFQWISCQDADHCVVSFIRKSKKEEETLFIVYNFTPIVYNKFRVGVPFQGKYKEIFNSDAVKYSGSGIRNPRVKESKKISWDGCEDSIEIVLPPLGMVVFSCSKGTNRSIRRTREKNQQFQKKASKTLKGETIEKRRKSTKEKKDV